VVWWRDDVRFRRSLVIITVALAIGAGIAAISIWGWLRWSREEPLPPDWTAAAFVYAGDGRAGARDGPALRARFSEPFGVAVGMDGSVYVADAGEAQAIRRIAPDGMVSTIARGFDTPSGLAIDRAGVLYVADTGANAIRRVALDGSVTTLSTDFNGPVGVAVAPDGDMIVADTYNDRIRAIGPDGTVRDVTDAWFDTPCGVAVDAAGTIYVAETGAGLVRAIARSGQVTTVEPLPYDGLFRPIGIAVAGDGAIYVTDERGRIVEIRPGVSARVLVGDRPTLADGRGDAVPMRAPAGVAVAGEARLVITEPRNGLVRLVAAASRVELRPPAPPDIAPAFDAAAFARQPLLWPIDSLVEPYEITGTLGEPRGSVGDRFHAGLDVQADRGTPVIAVRPGVVTEPIATSGFGGLNESVRIGPIAYVHIKVGRLEHDELLPSARFVPTYDEQGKLTRIRVKRGARFTTGETIGSVNAFYHVHLNVGWPGEEHNPLRFRLVNFADTVPPTIARRGVQLLRESGEPLRERRRGRLIVDGRVRLIVDAWDQVDGNLARRRLGLYRLGYQVLHRDGTPAPGFDEPRETLVFDRLGPDPDGPRIVYESGSGIPFYGTRRTRFLYVVTNTLRDGIASRGVWDTSTLPPGDYTLRILAADINGNEAIANRDVPVTVVGDSSRGPDG
jgi:murein DD-endopeptidase MepM/ murein hydrolase activator NlpD